MRCKKEMQKMEVKFFTHWLNPEIVTTEHSVHIPDRALAVKFAAACYGGAISPEQVSLDMVHAKEVFTVEEVLKITGLL